MSTLLSVDKQQTCRQNSGLVVRTTNLSSKQRTCRQNNKLVVRTANLSSDQRTCRQNNKLIVRTADLLCSLRWPQDKTWLSMRENDKLGGGHGDDFLVTDQQNCRTARSDPRLIYPEIEVLTTKARSFLLCCFT